MFIILESHWIHVVALIVRLKMPKKGYKPTEEHRRKISENSKINPNYGMKGKHQSEEAKEKIRKFLIGRQLSEERRKNISRSAENNPNYGMRGKHNSPETRRKISESNMGHIVSEETKEKLRKTHIGIKVSEETKKKMREHSSKYWLGKTKETCEILRKTAIKQSEIRKRLFNEGRIPRINSGCFKKGQVSPRKGIKLSEESKLEMSKAKLRNPTRYWVGKKRTPMTEEQKRKISQSINSPEIKEKICKARANQILPIKDTKIELKIQNFLKQLGIDFFTHQYMKEIKHGYQCDILIPSMNLVVECDGDYWHKYPIGKEIDHIRTSELLEKGLKS